MKKKILCLCTICIFMILCTACGKEKNLQNINFSDHDVYLGETKDQLKEDFGNFLSEDGDRITLLDEKKGTLSLTMMNDKVAFISSDDKSIDYNGLTIGSSIEDVSSYLGVDKNFIGNDSQLQIFYDSNNNIVYKTNGKICANAETIPDEYYSFSEYKKKFFTNYGDIKKSNLMLEMSIKGGVLHSLNISSSNVYLKLTNIQTAFIDHQIINFGSMTNKDASNLIEDYDFTEEDDFFTTIESDSDKEWNDYVMYSNPSPIGGLKFSKNSNEKCIYSIENSDLIISNLYYGEPIDKTINTLDITKDFAQKNNDIVIFYNSKGKEVAKYDDGESFFNSDNTLPEGAVYQLRVKFTKNKISALNLFKY